MGKRSPNEMLTKDNPGNTSQGSHNIKTERKQISSGKQPTVS